ncbi:MAG: DUF488 domain-containing protein [Planctomycetota bacterium]
MGIKTKSIYDKETKDEGVRLLIMRRWPRGIRKTRIDEWDKDLSPSPELLDDWNTGKIPFKEFKKRYISEMRAPLQKGKIAELAGRAKRQEITLFCHEEEDSQCHRKMLEELINKGR